MDVARVSGTASNIRVSRIGDVARRNVHTEALPVLELVDAYVTSTVGWYEDDKRQKARWSQFLRATAILLGAAGGLVPLVSAALQGEVSGWGYVLLAAAATCAAFDQFFGVSSAWMRDITTLLALQRAIMSFNVQWITLSSAPPDEEAILRQIQLLADLQTSVSDLVEQETAKWVGEFQSSLELAKSQVDGRTVRPTAGE